MVDKYLVAQLLHENCGDDHTEDRHRYDAIVYSNRVNDAGIDATAEQVASAIIWGVNESALVRSLRCRHTFTCYTKSDRTVWCEACNTQVGPPIKFDAERNGFPPVS